MRKKRLKILLIVCLLLLSIQNLTYATDFEGNEEYYIKKCKVSPLPKNDIQICDDFNKYLKDKTGQISSNIKDIKSKLSDIEDDIFKIQQTIDGLNEKIDDVNQEMEYLAERIVVLEASIEEKDLFIRERMYETQGLNNGNIYVDMLMGSSSLEEFFSVMSALNELLDYDYSIMKEFEKDKEDLEDAKLQVEEQKKELEDLKSLKEEVEALLLKQRADYDEELQKQYEQSDKFKSDMQDIQKAIDAGNANLENPPTSSGSWGQPVARGIVTAVGWYYPGDDFLGGKPHSGMDIGAPIGTALYAPANGIVIHMYMGCPTSGSGYGDSCAGGMGNNIVIIVQVEGKTYAVKYYHMKKDNVIGWSSGNFVTVSKGQLVGYVGHSGSSTGAHLHLEVINLGNMSYTEAASLYARKGGSFGLGTGYSAFSNRCSVKSAPCRETASGIFGYSLYQELK